MLGGSYIWYRYFLLIVYRLKAISLHIIFSAKYWCIDYKDSILCIYILIYINFLFQANETRDTLAKALYCRMVLSVVKRINSVFKPNSKCPPYVAPSISSEDTQSSGKFNCTCLGCILLRTRKLCK